MNAPSSASSSFLRSVRTTAAYNLAATATSALTGILLARWLGPSGRGDYAAITAYMVVALIICELGLGSSVVYHISRNIPAQADYVKTATALLLPMALVAAVASAILGQALFGNSGDRHRAFIFIPICIALSLIGAPATGALQSLAIVRWNAVRVLVPVLFLILVLITESRASLDAASAIIALAIALAIQTCVAWLLYLRSYAARSRFLPASVVPMLRYGLLNMSSTTPNSLNGRVDQLVLAFVVSSAALGQYAVAVSLSLLAAPFAMAFGYVAFPSIAKGETVSQTIRTAARGSLFVSLVVVIAVVALAPFAVPLVVGSGYRIVPQLLLLLAPGAVVFSVNRVLGDLLRGLGRPGLVAICEWLGVSLTVAGLIVLVPYLGVAGAAVTSSVTYCLVYVLLRRAVSKSGNA